MSEGKKIMICVLEPLETDSSVIAAVQKLKKEKHIPFVFSSCGTEYLADTHTWFVIKEFDGPVFENLYRHKARVLGPTALVNASNGDERIDLFNGKIRPLYNFAMHGTYVTFTGYRDKPFHAQLNLLSRLVQYMGGKVRRDTTQETTHLVARVPGGAKYVYAGTFQLPILDESWILDTWEHRRDLNFIASSVVNQYKLMLKGVKISFLGFSSEDTQTYEDYLIKNCGEVVEANDPNCTHLVVNDKGEDAMPAIPENVIPSCKIVRSEWWWKTMELVTYQEVNEFLLFEDAGYNSMGGSHTPSTPGSATSRAIKRKRQQQLAGFSGSPARGKRRSSATLDFSGNYLDCTLTPDKDASDGRKEPKLVTARQLKFLELVSTETNYVDILNVIVSSFKTPLENKEAQDETIKNEECLNPILDSMEIKLIFGNVPPILDVHREMLEELKALSKNWTDDSCIGKIISDRTAELEKAYPPFVNNFEKSRETLEQCEKSNPRFHAFLKIRQMRPECGRQTLKELLIRPVQRLASINLLLQDLVKRTEPSHPDHTPLQQALDGIRDVLKHINEDKRRTEAQVAILEFFNQIENCPPDLVSSSRNLIAKCECLEKSEGRKGDPVTLMVLTDTIEICGKRRNKNFSLKGTKSLNKCNKMKPFKHLRHIRLNHILRVIDLKISEEEQNEFAIVVNEKMQQWSNESPQKSYGDRLKVPSEDDDDSIDRIVYTFSVLDDAHTKPQFLDILCQQIATHCLVDPDSILKTQNKAQLGLEDHNKTQNNHTLSRAFRFASSAKKMGRALSLSRTPSRASRIMPRRADSTSSTHSPGLVRRLESCANLNDSITSINSMM